MRKKSRIVVILSLLSILVTGCSPQQKNTSNSSVAMSTANTAASNNPPQEFADWKEAYRYILNHHRDYISDPFGYQQQAWDSDTYHLYEDTISIATHDFNEDGTPELILGADCASTVIYTFYDGKIVKEIELPLDETYSCVNLFPFMEKNTIVLIQEYNRSQYRYVACCYLEGSYKVGTYDGHPPLKTAVDGQSVSKEELFQLFPILKKWIAGESFSENQLEQYFIDPETHGFRTRQILEQYNSYLLNKGKGALSIGEDFDLSIFAR